METQDTNNRNEHGNKIANDHPSGSHDAREQANNGNWEEQRDDTRTDQEDYDFEQNYNTGGAGSTGSAATNS